MGIKVDLMEIRTGRRKRVRQIDIETNEEIEIYGSISEAAEDNWMTYTTLSDALRNKNGILKIRKLKFELIE